MRPEAVLSATRRESLHQELMETYLAKRENLLRFLAARVGSRSLAEDILQDLFIRLAGIDADLAVQNPNALIYRMAANLAVDHLRQRRRASARMVSWGLIVQPTPGEAVSDQASPEQAWAGRQRLAALVRAVDALPPRMRQAFRLCKLEERSRDEAAEIMGISVKAVEKQITAALKALAWSDE